MLERDCEPGVSWPWDSPCWGQRMEPPPPNCTPTLGFHCEAALGAENLTENAGFDLRGPVPRLSVPGSTAAEVGRPGEFGPKPGFLPAGKGKGRNRLDIHPGPCVRARGRRMALVMR